jgi:hypothetical protein
MTIESTLLPDRVSFASLSSDDTLIEQSFYSAHQIQKSHVVVEPQLPRVTNDLDYFGERGRGDFEDFPFLDAVTCMKGTVTL